MRTKAKRQLSAAHREQLIAGSGLTAKVIEARGYFSATNGDLRRLGFKGYQCAPGLVIPQFDPKGLNGGYQLRRDQPRKDRDGREVKYETPAGSRLHLDVNPLMVKALSDPSVDLLITEGAKKGDAAVSHGICAVDVPGVWGWKKAGQPIADWDLIPLKGRQVFIAFDSDVMAKAEVAKALEELTGYLAASGADVHCIYLPNQRNGAKQGIDDYLLIHPNATLQALAAKKATKSLTRFTTADGAVPAAIEWWWTDHIPVGKFGLLDGDPGFGKSVILCDLIASATSGRALPDGSRPLRVGGVVLFAAEDGYLDTIVPRLDAAGADRSKVIVAHAADHGHVMSLPRDLHALAELIDSIGAVLVAFDPWEFYLNADIIKGKEQRERFEPVKRLIADKRVVLIGTRHLNQQSGQKALYRGRGDITAIGMSRYGFIVGRDPKSENQRIDRVMVPLKYNLSPASRVHAVRYVVEEVALDALDKDGQPIRAPRIQWNGQTDITADQAVDSQGAQAVTAKQIMEAKVLPLLQMSGPMRSEDGWAIMRQHGINGRGNVSQACKDLGIHATKEGMSGPWWWYLDGQLEMVPGQMKVTVEKRPTSTNIHPRKATRGKNR